MSAADATIAKLREAVKHFPEGEPGDTNDLFGGDLAMDMIEEVIGEIRVLVAAESDDDLLKLAHDALLHPENHEWSLQGFGMLRTYLTDEARLHVWDSRYAVENVSQMHTHPWHFHSTVIAGFVRNRRFEEVLSGLPYKRQTIKCGAGGGPCGFAEEVQIEGFDVELYQPGEKYTQRAHEIHVSMPEDGAVTLCVREFLDDTEHAYVYWPDGSEWVSAEPRPATIEEIRDIVGNCKFVPPAQSHDYPALSAGHTLRGIVNCIDGDGYTPGLRAELLRLAELLTPRGVEADDGD